MTEPVNERPIFPQMIRGDQIGVNQWSVSLIRQLTTVFQQYGYKLNKTAMEDDLDDYALLGGDNTFTGENTFTPSQVFSAPPSATGNPLRWNELAENGGTLPETDRVNNFAFMPEVGGDPIVESGSNSDGEWTRWADGTQHCRNSGDTLTTSSGAGNVFITSSNQSFTFPQSFTVTPHAIDASRDAGAGSLGFTGAPRGVTTTNLTIRPYSHANNADMTLGYFATGLWK